jgi:hypothetical protein
MATAMHVATQLRQKQGRLPAAVGLVGRLGRACTHHS